MAFIDGFTGKVAPAILLLFKGEAITGTGACGTPTSHNYLYLVKNQSLTKFAITGQVGGTMEVWDREATQQKPYYDQTLNTYTLPPIEVDSINLLVDSPGTIWRIDIEFSYKPFFEKLLYYMVHRDPNNLFNFAKPDAPQAVLDTLIYTRPQNNNQVVVTYKTNSVRYENIPLKLRTPDKPINDPTTGVPAVKLTFEMDFLTGLDDMKREIMRRLIAMDYTTFLKHGRGISEVAALDESAKVWRENIVYYLLNLTDKEHGDKIRKSIYDQCLTPVQTSARDAALGVRNQVDAWMVTANHWAQRREDWKTETYQKIISDVIGTIHQTANIATPVSFIRTLVLLMGISANYLERCNVILQYGLGHCGEHAIVAYALLDSLKSAVNSKIEHVVHTGNANIDHAFAIINLNVQRVIRTSMSANNPLLQPGHSQIQVFDLRQAEADNVAVHKTGYVVDAYLAPSEQALQTDQLLTALNDPARRAGKETDFLRFVNESPFSVAYEDRASVKNV